MENTIKTETNTIAAQNSPIANITDKRSYPKFTVSPEAIRKIKTLKAKGLSNLKISKETHISRPTIGKIVNDQENKEDIEIIKKRIVDKSARLAEISLDSINPTEIKDASLMQRVTIYGIMTDKVSDLTKNDVHDIGDGNLLQGLKKDDLMNYLKDGNSINIGIVIKPQVNKESVINGK